ncbi:MAG TPA: PAS domain-containing protein [Gemmatirosa sp.]
MHPDFVGFADEFGERRRRAEDLSSPLLRALGLVARDAGPEAGSSIATVHATSDLITDTLADLGRAEEELRAQNEALFAAQTELELEQQVFRDLFDLAPTASLVTTGGGQIVRANQAALELLARPMNAVVGKPLAAYVAMPDRAAFRIALCRSRQSARVETWPVRLTPKQGDPIECRVRTRALHLPYGGTTPPAGPALHWVVTEELPHSSDDLV